MFSFMSLKQWRYLLQEFFHPCRIGIFFDGKELIYAKDQEPEFCPARAYIAISHQVLYFHTLKLPISLPLEKAFSAARIEASRLFSLFQDRSSPEIACALLRTSSQEVLMIFQEKAFLQEALRGLPEGLVPCGFFPAAIALLAWFYTQGGLKDGLYFLRRSEAIEGFVWREGQLVKILPSSPKAAEAFIESFEGEVFETPSEAPERLLAQGAQRVPDLPSEWIVTFAEYPLRLRPQIPKKAVALWLLPLFLLSVGQGLDFFMQRLEVKEKTLRQEVETFKKQYNLWQNQKKKQEALRQLSQEVQKFVDNRPPLLKALLELTRILPNGSWIRKWEFRAPQEIRIWGESEDSLEILKRLEESPIFSQAKFLSTVTKNPRTGKENFAIRANLENSPSS